MQFSLANTKSILTWLICITYAGLFFPLKISNIALITLLLFCAVNINPKEIYRLVKGNIFALLLIGLFVLQIAGLLYTNNLKTGFFMLEKKICFLLIPIFVFPVLQKVSLNYNLLFKRIGVITVLSSLILLLIAAFRKWILQDALAFSYVSGNEYKGFTSIHYVYYAMYFACGFLIFMDTKIDHLRTIRYGWLKMGMLIFYGLGIMILVASKTGIIIFILALIIFFYIKLPNKKISGASIIFILISASVFMYLNENTRNRFIGLDQNLSVLKEDVLKNEFEATGLNMRLLFWKISLTHLWADGLVLSGVGTGDAQDYIDSLYKLPQYQLYGYVDWDSHNQWVYTLIQVGIAGVLLLGLLFARAFLLAVRRVDLKLMCFLIVTLSFSCSESILELNKGIVFFALFIILLTTANVMHTASQKDV